jgi:hypothetical protein
MLYNILYKYENIADWTNIYPKKHVHVQTGLFDKDPWLQYANKKMRKCPGKNDMQIVMENGF